jgi:hypothetical protein
MFLAKNTTGLAGNSTTKHARGFGLAGPGRTGEAGQEKMIFRDCPHAVSRNHKIIIIQGNQKFYSSERAGQIIIQKKKNFPAILPSDTYGLIRLGSAID